MAWLKETGRVGRGLSLVAKEALRQGASSSSLSPQDLIRTLLLTATDVTGLTKGNIHPFSFPPPSSRSSTTTTTTTTHDDDPNTNKSDRDSVVHFADYSPPTTTTTISLSLDSSSTTSPQGEGSSSTVNAPPHHHTTTTTTADYSQEDSVPDDDAAAAAAVVHNVTGGEGAAAVTNTTLPQTQTPPPLVVNKQKRRPRERRVPSTPFSRAIGFAGLGAGLAWGTLQESAKRLVFGTPDSLPNRSASSPFLSEKNAERLALALCRMRGAALKLGQMLSIQDESLVPAPILAALDIVRQGADVMPRSQLNQVLDAELGPDWSSKLKSFDYEPMAAASIGQVHRAVTKDDLEVAMKIQYPGVANSIDSDIDNVKLLLDYTNILPEKLYLDRAIIVAKEELSRECDYELEATNQRRFRKLLCNTTGFYVPLVVDDILSKRVLTTELVPGIPIDKVALLDQDTRNYVGRKLLELTLMELFVFRFMQTDPNWSNFLYDENARTMNLIDFGAARDYPKRFVDDYLRMVVACANSDREAVIEMSKRLGFLTGMESEIMLEAHVQASFVVGLPFSKGGGYDFRSTNITQSLSNLGATMLRHRLTPPPDEAYSLHRKLSGAFLACIKLGSIVPCRDLLLQVHEIYHFGEEDSG